MPMVVKAKTVLVTPPDWDVWKVRSRVSLPLLLFGSSKQHHFHLLMLLSPGHNQAGRLYLEVHAYLGPGRDRDGPPVYLQ